MRRGSRLLLATHLCTQDAMAMPPPPCFDDVLEAQRWATAVVQQAAEESARRGRRGSQAWEDVWRDALWTLAVQKRCVEVEARRRPVAATASTATAAAADASTPASPSATGAQSSAVAPNATRPGAGTASQPHPAQPGAAAAGPGPAVAVLRASEAEVALRQGAEIFERRCLDPVHRRLDGIDESLNRLGTGLAEAVRTARETEAEAVAGIASDLQSSPPPPPLSGPCIGQLKPAFGPLNIGPGHFKAGDSASSAGPLPPDPCGSGPSSVRCGDLAMEAAAVAEQQSIVRELRRQLAEAEGREQVEVRRRCEVEESHRAECAVLRVLEAERDEANRRLREVQASEQHIACKFQEAETKWQQRHTSVHRQLQRAELSLNAVSTSPPSSFALPPRSATSSVPQDAAHAALDARHTAMDLEALGSPAILDLLREVRSLERRPSSAIAAADNAVPRGADGYVSPRASKSEPDVRV